MMSDSPQRPKPDSSPQTKLDSSPRTKLDSSPRTKLDSSPRPKLDYDRTLGVVECFTIINEQCPSGAVRAVAERAMQATREGGPGVLREQAWYVLTAMKGWRGERASQVHRSLSEFIESSKNET